MVLINGVAVVWALSSCLPCYIGYWVIVKFSPKIVDFFTQTGYLKSQFFVILTVSKYWQANCQPSAGSGWQYFWQLLFQAYKISRLILRCWDCLSTLPVQNLSAWNTLFTPPVCWWLCWPRVKIRVVASAGSKTWNRLVSLPMQAPRRQLHRGQCR